jgi:hypothetical protein
MEKIIKPIMKVVDSFMPGYKTYFMMLIGIGMSVCQMMGYHQFEQEAWGLLGIGGAATWKMGQDRKKK